MEKKMVNENLKRIILLKFGIIINVSLLDFAYFGFSPKNLLILVKNFSHSNKKLFA